MAVEANNNKTASENALSIGKSTYVNNSGT
jgi:hypothetical protein